MKPYPLLHLTSVTPAPSQPRTSSHAPRKTRKMSFDAPLPSFNASDPNATFLNSSALDLLLIEIVPLARRLAVHTTNATEGEGTADEDEQREAMFYRLEQLGFKVGQGLVERYVRAREGGRASG